MDIFENGLAYCGPIISILAKLLFNRASLKSFSRLKHIILRIHESSKHVYAYNEWSGIGLLAFIPTGVYPYWPVNFD